MFRLFDDLRNALAPVAQWIEHSFPKAGVAGSIPARGAFFTEFFCRLGLLALSIFYRFVTLFESYL